MGATGTLVLDFGDYPGATDAVASVAGQAGILAGSKVEAWLRPSPTTLDYRALILGDNPLGYWRLGETQVVGTSNGGIGVAVDEVGFSPGTYHWVSTPPTFEQPGAVSGDANTAVKFDAPDSSNTEYFFAPNGGTYLDGLSAITWSMEAWSRLLSPTAYLTQDLAILNVYLPTSFKSTVVRFRWDGGAHLLRPSIYSGLTEVWGRVVDDSEWHHYALTCDAGSLVLYLDGEYCVSVVDPSPAVASQKVDVFAGRSYDALNGIVADEVAFYGYVLSQDQIRAHYRAGHSGTYPEAHTDDEHRVEALKVFAYAPTAGVGFTVRGVAASQRGESARVCGRWNVAWAWS